MDGPSRPSPPGDAGGVAVRRVCIRPAQHGWRQRRSMLAERCGCPRRQRVRLLAALVLNLDRVEGAVPGNRAVKAEEQSVALLKVATA